MARKPSTKSSAPKRIRLVTDDDGATDWAIPAGFEFDESEQLMFRAYCRELRALGGTKLLPSDMQAIAHLVEEARIAARMTELGRIALAEGNSPEFRALCNAASRARKNMDSISYGLGLRRNERGHKDRQRQAGVLVGEGGSSIWGDLLTKPMVKGK